MSKKYINSFIIKNAGDQEQAVRIKIPLTQVEGASDLMDVADATARKLASLKEELEYQEDILTAQGVILKETIPGTYSIREVAGGLDIYDGSLAEVKKVEGKTIKSKNLVDEKNPSAKPNQWTYNNGIWQGINPHYQPLKFLLSVTEGKTYAVSLNLLNGSTGTENRVLVKDGETTVLSQPMQEGLKRYEYLFTAKITGIYTVNLVGYGDEKNFYFNNLQVEEVEEGSVATEYEPYFEGLKHTTFGGIKSTGKNLFNAIWTMTDGAGNVFFESKEKIAIVPNTRNKFTFSTKLKFLAFELYVELADGTTQHYPMAYNNTIQYLSIENNVVYYGKADGIPKTFDSNIVKLGLRVYGKNGWTNDVNEMQLQLENGFEQTAYEPYKESILEFPKTELGWGDEIDFEKQQIIQNTKEYTFDGSEDWGGNGANNFHLLNCTMPKSTFEGISSQWGYARAYQTNNDCVFVETNKVLYTSSHLTETFNKDLSLWKAHLQAHPLTIRYEIADPVITSFTTDQIAAGNEYRVYEGGTEQVIDNDAVQWGADLILTQEYITKPGGGSDGN